MELRNYNERFSDAMNDKDRFLHLYETNIQREGADRLLEYLQSPQSDFFRAPASTRFHGAFEGGLLRHSLNVYDCLTDYMNRTQVSSVYGLSCSTETLTIVSLLHDVCKINCYKPGFRNVKDENGVWKKVPYYEYDDQLPYGHGEKSVYITTGFMKLTREESFAIRFHMGFSVSDEVRLVSDAYEKFPLAFALHTADMEATLFLEKTE